MICFAYHNLETLLGFLWEIQHHEDEIDKKSNAKSMDEI
jgi:hypothetical protein